MDKNFVRKWIVKIFIAVLLLFFLIFPIFASSYILHVLIIMFLYAYLGSCWSILSGYTGQFSLGHSAFFGIGAYTSTILFITWGISSWIGMFCGAFLGMLAGLLVGYVSFRYSVKGIYFALVTVAFSIVLKQVALYWKAIGGAQGLLVPLSGPSFVLFQFDDKRYYYYIILFLFLIIISIIHLSGKFRTGSYFRAIREDEEAAESVGVNSTRYKLIAVAISSFMTAIGGTFYAQYLSYIEPETVFGLSRSVDIILRPIVGGMETLFGPLLGSVIMVFFSEITRTFLGNVHQGLDVMAYSVILIVVVLFLPHGIMAFLQSAYKSFFVDDRATAYVDSGDQEYK